ncbi:UBX domain-containing protein Ubx2 [Histoplasma capsulatum G186AR]|uniref:UBX domain-containing protein Ubx2 n=2 Tax=Ajellomyces capsulatus TaxID=5037 RepID=C0NWR4_AJECG|nr:UBX domain-containing protein Ubx2 [Histoplasma capsulatum G186AR]EEH04369.1 UBX domain-containing protein Ubx2 [Histoplasma capsulatum G186AR]KAG5291328.1 UBX domain-containing protein Ubx2 [Histoplasma capsulatum]QSS68631.1 UBX domain-containing protein Ubx2 [Histoplasma capsulatum G186AR]
MADAAVAGFTEITGSSPEVAARYLQLTDGNLETAMQLYFENGGADIQPESTPPQPQFPVSRSPPLAPPPPPSSRPSRPSRPPGYEDEHGVVHLDSDDDYSYTHEGGTNIPVRTSHQSASSASRTPQPAGLSTFDDDEAMARRLQEEFYAGAEGFGPADESGVRAPLARTTETLVEPGVDLGFDINDGLDDAVMSQLRARQRARAGRPGIFNQRPISSSIWNQDDPSSHRASLAEATGGASNASSKSSMLAEMYRPPFEIMSKLPWDLARDEGRENMRWLLVNIQDASVFDCQVLNRDLWKNQGVMDTVKEHFIFLQYSKDDPRGSQYIQYYFPGVDVQDNYPHIAIVDPRTGEQVKAWTGPPVIKPSDFLMQVHEFLDRYSLDHTVRNPVARRKPEVKPERKLETMTEEEMLEMALKNSLESQTQNNNVKGRHEDPDDLTRSIGDIKGKGKGKASSLDDDMNVDAETNGQQQQEQAEDSHHQNPTFASISPNKPHTEPNPDPATVTRIQFRHPTGRVIRRFNLSDPVRRIYEWLKASPLSEDKAGVEFELVSMGQNLIGMLDVSISDAGLKNGTVMIGFVED